MYVMSSGCSYAGREVVEAELRVQRGEVHEHVVEAREVADRRRDADVRVERVEVRRAADGVGTAGLRRAAPFARRFVGCGSSPASASRSSASSCRRCRRRSRRATPRPRPRPRRLSSAARAGARRAASSSCPSSYRPFLVSPFKRKRLLQPASGTTISQTAFCVKRYVKSSSRFLLRVLGRHRLYSTARP